MAAERPEALIRFLAGAGLVLVAVAMAEMLIASGLRPLSPLGLPGLALVTAAALLGAWGFAGGAAITLAYYLANAAWGNRFPEFFAYTHIAVAWMLGLLL